MVKINPLASLQQRLCIAQVTKIMINNQQHYHNLRMQLIAINLSLLRLQQALPGKAGGCAAQSL